MSTASDRAVLSSIFNPLFPAGDYLKSRESPTAFKVKAEDTPTEREAAQFELQGVKAAEAGDLNKALEYFTKAVELSPNRASCYNNRAQAYRLQNNTEDALTDLNTAITLSDGIGSVACKAFCQRGLIYQLKGLQQNAKEDFELAAKLGSEFAKAVLIQLNPYSALCNQMLTEMLMKEKLGESFQNS